MFSLMFQGKCLEFITNYSQRFDVSLCDIVCISLLVVPLADPGLGQGGGPRNFSEILLT